VGNPPCPAENQHFDDCLVCLMVGKPSIICEKQEAIKIDTRGRRILPYGDKEGGQF
jgi:hypothetical protein